MAKIYNNSKNFLIIELNSTEATKCNFGVPTEDHTNTDNICICGTCNNICEDNAMYYIASINEVMCKECVDDFISNMNHYIDENSIKYESEHFNHYAKILNLKTISVITIDNKLKLVKDKQISNNRM